MKRNLYIWCFLALFFLQTVSTFGQFLPTEVMQREQWEKFLKTAEIVSSEDVGEGVTEPIKIELREGNIERGAVWKNPKGMQKGFLEGWHYEIAASRMDKLLELNMIPPTVEREFKGKPGSLQLWVKSEYSLLRIMEENIPIPESELIHFNRMKYIVRAFDSLIANEDRTQQNILYTKDWRMILIDHSRSFRSSKKFTQKLIFGNDSEGRPKPFRELPKSFVEKIRALSFESIKDAVGPYLEDKEIQAILIRKELVLKEIDDMIKEKGRDKVLYE